MAHFVFANGHAEIEYMADAWLQDRLGIQVRAVVLQIIRMDDAIELGAVFEQAIELGKLNPENIG